MPYPRWLAKINKHLFNPREIRKGKRPVVIHVGRSTGTVYQTPLDAHPAKRGYVLVVRYGPDSDWVRNILAAGTAILRVEEKSTGWSHHGWSLSRRPLISWFLASNPTLTSSRPSITC
jgi:hypothetical protein